MAHSQDQRSFQQDVIVMFGDSITQNAFVDGGLGTALSSLYPRVFDVMNRGLSGYNSKWAIPIMSKWLPRKQEDRPRTALMTVWFGANDSVLSGGLQSVPIDDYKRNLHRILEMAVADSPTTELLLLTPPPVDPPAWAVELERRHGKVMAPDRTIENTRLYAEACKEVGREAGVPCVDTWSALNAEAEKLGGLDSLLYDGLHLTSAGYKIVIKAVKDTIENELPALHWDNLKPHYPYWADIPNDGALGEEYRVVHQKD